VLCFCFVFFVLCTICCQFLWIVHCWWPYRWSLAFIYNKTLKVILLQVFVNGQVTILHTLPITNFPHIPIPKTFFIETKFDLKNIKYMYMYHIFQNVSSNNSRISIRMHFHNIIIENDHITIRFLFKVDYCFTIISYDGLLWYLTF
jgi:hypothetical protein